MVIKAKCYVKNNLQFQSIFDSIETYITVNKHQSSNYSSTHPRIWVNPIKHIMGDVQPSRTVVIFLLIDEHKRSTTKWQTHWSIHFTIAFVSPLLYCSYGQSVSPTLSHKSPISHAFRTYNIYTLSNYPLGVIV